jgi:hypothetical protein
MFLVALAADSGGANGMDHISETLNEIVAYRALNKPTPPGTILETHKLPEAVYQRFAKCTEAFFVISKAHHDYRWAHSI